MLRIEFRSSARTASVPNWWAISPALHLGILRQGLSLDWSSPSRLRWLVSEPQGSSCPSLSSTGITSTFYHTYLAFYTGYGGWTQALMLTCQVMYWLFGLILNVNFRDRWTICLSSPQSPLLKGSTTFQCHLAGEQVFNTHDSGNISDPNFSRGNNKKLTKHSSIPMNSEDPRATWWWQTPLHSLAHYCLPNPIS